MMHARFALVAGFGLSVLVGHAPAGQRLVKPTNLDKVNTADDEDDPAIVSDGKTLLYSSNATGKFQIMQSLLNRGWQKGKLVPGLGSKEADFRTPFYFKGKLYFATNTVPDEKLKDLKNFDLKVSISGRQPLPLLQISTKEDELHPWITRDEEFFFSRKTAEGWVLYVASGVLPGPPKAVGFDPGFSNATLSTSGLVMYLQGPLDGDRVGLYRSKRVSLKGKWSKPEPLAMLNHPKATRGDMSPCLAPDGKRLYFASDRPESKGGLDLWSIDTSLLSRE